MAVITISRGSYSRGKEVAELIARRLGYECIAREILLEASEDFNIPAAKLLQAISDAPSMFARYAYGKERYVAFIQAALLKRVQKNNVVYHGFAGHFFLKGVSHVLKVRIIADLEDRIKIVMDQEKISRKEAIRFLENIDEERLKWGKFLYGVNTRNPSLYDLVINVKSLSVEDAADIICYTAGMKRFETTQASQSAMDDLVLSALAKVSIIDLKPDAEVSAEKGVIYVSVKAPADAKEEMALEIAKLVSTVPGVIDVKVQVIPGMPVE